MGCSLRYATAAEFAAVAELDGASFGFHYSAQDLEDALLDVDPTGMLVALEHGRIVGVSGEMPFSMTVPGGRIQATGLTWVSVEVTHRRKGILTSMLEQQLRNCLHRGVPVVILAASEGGIYGRYGFGVATCERRVVIDRRAARLIRESADHAVLRLSNEQAIQVLPPLYERWRQQTPGALDRSGARWRMQLLDREHQRDGASGLFHLVHAGGYVSYRIKTDWNYGHPQHVCAIADYAICTPEAHAALWQVLLGMDLCVTIESDRVPVDDPLPHLITDPRRVRTTELNDGLWVRPLDVSALLAARTYALEIDVALHVVDPLLGNTTVRLRGGPDGATCERTSDSGDVSLRAAELGAISLGGSRLASLARAGRVRADDPATVVRLDRAFLGDVAPQRGTAF